MALRTIDLRFQPLAATLRALRSQWLESLLAGGIHIPRRYDPSAARACVAHRTILITGASSGIGRALARKLGALGARVILVARSEPALRSLELEIRRAGGRARVYALDLSTASGVATLLERLDQDGARVDVLVNNAARSIRRTLAESHSRPHDYERTIALNYLGALRLSLGLLPGMRARQCGQIVQISSLAVPWASPRFSAYVASKAALEAFSRVAAIETLADGVHWTTIHMPLVRTPMSAPTRSYARLPALSADQAADVIVRAIALRPTRVATFRSQLVQLGWAFAPQVSTRLLARLERLKAQGEPPAPPPRPNSELRRGPTMYMTQGLHRALQQHPERTALHFGERTRSFRQLGERVARLAGALQRLGVSSGDRVGILALNSDRYLEYQLAVPWAGAVINPCNVRWSSAEIAYSLRDCGTTLLFIDAAFQALAEPIAREAPCLRALIYTGDGPVPAGMHGYEALLSAAAPVPDACRRGDDVLGVFYTGGTTGFPKGVTLSHENICSSGLALLAEGIAPRGGVFLHAAPMFHIGGFGIAMPHHLTGNAHAIIPAFSPEAVAQSIERQRVTDVFLVPTMIQLLADYLEQHPEHDLGSLRRVVYGASTISEVVLDRAIAVLPGVEFFQGYGMTELSPLATLSPAWCHTPEGRKAGKRRSAGRAALCTEVRVVDKAGQELPRGVVGEVWVRGPNVMLGYWNSREQTEAALCDGWMRTGDAAYMDQDGFLFVVDRIKDMIKTGGENVFSAEVENVLAKHPAVASCAVIAIPSDVWGESVHAVVVHKSGSRVTSEALIAHCREHIAHYKCPRSVEFRASLPISGAGKVLKAQLRRPFWEGRDRQVG